MAPLPHALSPTLLNSACSGRTHSGALPSHWGDRHPSWHMQRTALRQTPLTSAAARLPVVGTAAKLSKGHIHQVPHNLKPFHGHVSQECFLMRLEFLGHQTQLFGLRASLNYSLVVGHNWTCMPKEAGGGSGGAGKGGEVN